MIHINVQQAYEIQAKVKDKIQGVTISDIILIIEAANRVSRDYETALNNVHDAAAEGV